MRYRVIARFADLQDGKHLYNAGDIFPREGFIASKKRIAELAGSDNKTKAPLIEAIPELKGEQDENPHTKTGD